MICSNYDKMLIPGSEPTTYPLQPHLQHRPPHQPRKPEIKGFISKFCSQSFRKMRKKLCTILRTVCAALLKLHNVSSHFPTSTHLNDIHGAKSLLAGLSYKET